MKKISNNKLDNMSIKDLRKKSGMSQSQFSSYLEIPLKTIQNWEAQSTEKRECKPYIINLIKEKLINDSVISEEDI